jgi:acyl-CoA synthetase (AMP-forming)/AMP-acid ligase II
VAELLIAVNPDEDSRLPLLLRVPLAGGDLLFRTSGTWPREKALFAYPVPLDEWPDDPWGSCGKPFEGIEIRIVDPVTGDPVPTGTVGEIQLRGPTP